MKKKIKIKLILLMFIAIFLHSFSIATRTVAQMSKSITITGYGCSLCNQEENSYSVGWVWSGNITFVSIHYYDVSMTGIEYTIISMTSNNGSYEWYLPSSHSLDGNYSLVVSDYSNNNINDSVIQKVYPIWTSTPTLTPSIPGYSIILIGLMIGLMVAIIAKPLIIKSRKR